MLPDVSGGSNSKAREGYWWMYLSGISSRCASHGVEYGGGGAAGDPREQELQNNRGNNSAILSQYTARKRQLFIRMPSQKYRSRCA
jgi:hypothetical protein